MRNTFSGNVLKLASAAAISISTFGSVAHAISTSAPADDCPFYTAGEHYRMSDGTTDCALTEEGDTINLSTDSEVTDANDHGVHQSQHGARNWSALRSMNYTNINVELIAGAAFISTVSSCEDANHINCSHSSTLGVGNNHWMRLGQNAGILVDTTKLSFIVSNQHCDYFKVVNTKEDSQIYFSGVSWNPTFEIDGKSIKYIGSEEPNSNMDCELPTPQKIRQLEALARSKKGKRNAEVTG